MRNGTQSRSRLGGARRPVTWAVALLSVLALAACGGDYPQSTLHPVGDHSGAIDSLYRRIFWWAVGVFIVVESVLVYVIFRYRHRPGAPGPVQMHGNTLLEITWTLAPAVVLIFIAVPTIQTIFTIDAAPPKGALEVQVIGHQWWWEFRYPEFGIVTANEMHLPAGRPVVLSMTSADVIHSLWLPKLAGKRDVIPGRSTRLVFTVDSTGNYAGQCTEFCGESHANMRMRAIVQDSAAFAVWVAGQQTTPMAPDTTDVQVARGARLYLRKGCIACHTVEGVSAGILGPNLSHVGSRTTIAAGILPNTRDALSRWLRDPPGEKPGSLMFKIEMTEDEIAALVAYLLSLR